MRARRLLVAPMLLALAFSMMPAKASIGPRVLEPTLVKFNESQSTNWSGYNRGITTTLTPFTAVSANWIVPTATPRVVGRAEHSSTWIGIGGGCINPSCLLGDVTLIQAGTESTVNADGTKSYSAWWELIPAPAITISNVPVSAGDTMYSEISQLVLGVWTIKLRNVTKAKEFVTTLPYPSTMTTVEWIVETPVVISTGGAGIAAMPKLSPVRFTNAKINGVKATLSSSERVNLVVGGQRIATPSTPGTSGDKFNVCTYTTTCAAP